MDPDHSPSNRERARAPRSRRRLWCDGCDGVYLHRDQRCPHCGVVNSKGARRERRQRALR